MTGPIGLFRIAVGRAPVRTAAVFLLVFSALRPGGVDAQRPRVVEERVPTEFQTLRVVEVAEGLEHPWAMAFLRDDRLLVTERGGRLKVVSQGAVTEVAMRPLGADSQRVMLDLAVHPQHEANGWVYTTYARGDGRTSVIVLARARVDGDRLVELEELFRTPDFPGPSLYYGSRIAFLGDGTLLMSVGDRGSPAYLGHDPGSYAGKVLRLTERGRVPDDNPFVGTPEFLPEIYSYGHRNIQGLVVDPASGEAWATEHGPRGGDELNRIEAGKNYGWPLVSRGRDYESESPWGEARSRPDVEEPVVGFLTTLAPSGLALVDSPEFEPWRGNLLVGGRKSERIVRLVFDAGDVVHGEELLVGVIGPIRDLRQGPDGYIYVATDGSEAGIYRLEPVR